MDISECCARRYAVIKSPNVLTEAKNVIVLLARQNQVCCIVTLVTRSPLTATT